MKFNDVKSGYRIYLLDKASMKVSEVKVTAVGLPYPEPMKPGQLAQSMNRLVDVTVDNGEGPHVYAIPEGAGVTYAGDTVLSVDAEGILREVRAMKAHAEESLSKMDGHKECIQRCDAIISELDTSYKEKRELEGRLSGVESTVNELRDELHTFLKEMRK
jgi:hypothetical protein